MSEDYAYEGVHRVLYGNADTEEFWQFIPVCEKCGRFVKADDHVTTSFFGFLVPVPNATCKKCGRVQMILEGSFAPEEVGKK